MNFSDGYWLDRPGFKVDHATQICGVETDERSITLHASVRWISNRGMALSGPMLTVRFTSTLENCIRVSIEHFSGAVKKSPSFTLSENADFKPVIRYTDGGFELISGKTKVRTGLPGCGWDVSYWYGDKLLTRSGNRSTSVITEEEWHRRSRAAEVSAERFFSHTDNGGNTYIREMLSISPGEYIYGFGEKFTPFVKNGQTSDIWNSDGGTCTPQSYKSVPFFVSSRNYGIFVDNTGFVSFDTASENVSRTAFTVQGESLVYYVFGGSSIAEVISRYTDLTGKPALPPAYSFGLWLSTSFTTDYSEKTVFSFIEEMENRGIPLSVFHFDCFWMKQFEWCGFEWDREKFPDPAGMIERLKSRGLRVCVWVNPYVSQNSPVFRELMEKGYFIMNRDGSVFQTDMWQPGLAIIDFTCPGARDWFAGKIRGLIAIGVDAVKTDFGERIPTDVVYHDGSDPFLMHNYYSYLYNRTVFDTLEEVFGRGKACVFARSATTGCQQFPVHWGGDCFSSYDSMWETLRGGLSLCMSGFGFFSHDISGFEDKATPDLYKRWTAFGLMSTHSRYHGSSTFRVPWAFDEESSEVARHFSRLKCSLMPYLFANAVKTHITGVPMMRALAVDYGYDRSALTVDTEYMLGESLLVAPVFSEDGTCEFYLPGDGIWTDIQTGEELSGGRWYTRKYDYFGLPLFAAPASVIVFGSCNDRVEYDYADGMRILVSGIGEGACAEAAVYDADGEPAAEIRAERSGDTLKVTVTGTDKPFTVESTQGLSIVICDK
ncbi:MAG: alpha-xylosidase [Ruminococcus sp.]|nr:alpha-xylosidase [Ruminococcus sp.]